MDFWDKFFGRNKVEVPDGEETDITSSDVSHLKKKGSAKGDPVITWNE